MWAVRAFGHFFFCCNYWRLTGTFSSESLLRCFTMLAGRGRVNRCLSSSLWSSWWRGCWYFLAGKTSSFLFFSPVFLFFYLKLCCQISQKQIHDIAQPQTWESLVVLQWCFGIIHCHFLCTSVCLFFTCPNLASLFWQLRSSTYFSGLKCSTSLTVFVS